MLLSRCTVFIVLRFTVFVRVYMLDKNTRFNYRDFICVIIKLFTRWTRMGTKNDNKLKL